MPNFKEIPVYEAVSLSVVSSPGSEIATLSTMGAKPILVHFPIGALPHLRRQIDAILEQRTPSAPAR